jgi:hypothetical protein
VPVEYVYINADLGPTHAVYAIHCDTAITKAEKFGKMTTPLSAA